MYEIAKLPREERGILFQNTAAKMGVNAAIIEEHFWVCLALDYLFHNRRLHRFWQQLRKGLSERKQESAHLNLFLLLIA